MNYRDRILDNLYRAATRAQNVGLWDQADTYLSIASRYETLWAALDGGWSEGAVLRTLPRVMPAAVPARLRQLAL